MNVVAGIHQSRGRVVRSVWIEALCGGVISGLVYNCVVGVFQCFCFCFITSWSFLGHEFWAWVYDLRLGRNLVDLECVNEPR